LDSINGQWGASKRRAPGADDNASGIATITEIIRIALKHNYKPQRTIKFMAYAAEEVGLIGSKHIANDFKKQNKKVVGVIQLDMTNYQGDETDILFMDDYTNKAQNQFLGTLVDEYVGVSWGYSRCGYGCSDHASWHRAGYPASMPHEATMDGGNPHIHSTRDTIEQSNGHAKHAAKFAKLGLAFMAELGK
ncbi:M20/M25/M40 family metallo-hydrolase, partial [bacterium]|nr:M20/M25/M40 family metallo-hydrolase [bacterium]